MGGNAKLGSEAIGTLANTLGSPEIASFAGTIGGATEKLAQFRDMANQSGSGALAFKAGLVGMVGILSFQIGSAIGNAIFQTEKWKDELELARLEAARLDQALLDASSRRFNLQLDEISVIRNPDDQSRETQKLLSDIERQIEDKNRQIREKLNAEEDFNTAWFGSPEDRAAFRDTTVEENQLTLLRQQRDTLREMTSERRKAIEEQAKENALLDKSQAYVDALKQEILYMQSTREEQIKLDAARNTLGDDTGEAERLLRERDAILAKQEAERQLEEERKKAETDKARAAEEAIKAAEREAKIKQDALKKQIADAEAAKQKEADRRQAEIDRVEGIKKAEMQRLELQRIEIEQGKEAAKVKALMNQGVDEASAKRIAAEEAAIEKLKQNAKGEGEKEVIGPADSINASQGRLTTRGPGEKTNELLREANASLKKLGRLDDIDRNLKNQPPAINFVGVG